MTPTTPADASPAAGEIVALISRAREFVLHPNVHFHYKDGAEVMAALVALLDASRAETDAAKRERDEAMKRALEAALDAANARAEALEAKLGKAVEATQKADTELSMLEGAGDGWQDIASAPRDGTEILLWFPEEVARGDLARRSGYWNGNSGGDWYDNEWASDGMSALHGTPTRWRPLPAPPREVK